MNRMRSSVALSAGAYVLVSLAACTSVRYPPASGADEPSASSFGARSASRTAFASPPPHAIRRCAAEDDPKKAPQLCAKADSDGDWVPDYKDRCPNTPELTATDDTGCPLAALPPAPSAEDVARVLEKMGMLSNPLCRDAPVPTRLPAGAFYWHLTNCWEHTSCLGG